MLEPIADDLWCLQRPLRAGGVTFPGRMTVVRLPSGGLWLHSPVDLSPMDADELRALGPVAYLVAPSGFHHLHMQKATALFPGAQVFASPVLRTKVPTLPIDHVLTDPAPEDWKDVVSPILLEGAPKVQEVVFVHSPSRSLLVTDLVFNMKSYDGWLSSLVFWMAGTHGKFACSRVFRSSVKDRAAMAASLRRVLAHEIERVIPCHGDVLERAGKSALQDALAPLLG